MEPRILMLTEKATITLEPNAAIKSVPIWSCSAPALVGLTVSKDGMSCEARPVVERLIGGLAKSFPFVISVRWNVPTGKTVREVEKTYPFELRFPETEAVSEKITVTAIG